MIFPVAAGAKTSAFDFEGVSQGFFSVNYSSASQPDKRVKVGVKFNGETVYHDYTQGETQSIPLQSGDGTYTVMLYLNKSGTSYKKIEEQKIQVEIQDVNAKYLISTEEIMFKEGDLISRTAAKLVKGKKSTQAKAMAIYNAIGKYFEYDYGFYKKVKTEKVAYYTPDVEKTLRSREGICYDFAALYAAMCRSVGIPCKLVKGNSKVVGGYHAWNSVYDEETCTWKDVDPTVAVTKNLKASSKWATIDAKKYKATSEI